MPVAALVCLETDLAAHHVCDQPLRLLDPMPCAVQKVLCSRATAGMFIICIIVNAHVHVSVRMCILPLDQGKSQLKKVEVGSCDPHE